MIISLFGGSGFGIHYNNSEDDERIKTITADEITNTFLDYLKNNLGLIENVERDTYAEKIYNSVLRASILDKSAWEVLDYERPPKAEVDEIKENLTEKGVKLPDESKYSRGTDMQIWVYENNTWTDYDKGLRVKVIIEFGNVIAIETLIDMEQSFFW